MAELSPLDALQAAIDDYHSFAHNGRNNIVMLEGGPVLQLEMTRCLQRIADALDAVRFDQRDVVFDDERANELVFKGYAAIGCSMVHRLVRNSADQSRPHRAALSLVYSNRYIRALKAAAGHLVSGVAGATA